MSGGYGVDEVTVALLLLIKIHPILQKHILALPLQLTINFMILASSRLFDIDPVSCFLDFW